MNSQSQTGKNQWMDILFSGLRFCWYTATELFYGFRYRRIDVARYLYPGAMIAAFFVARCDFAIAYLTGWDWLRLSMPLRELIVYPSLFAGFVIWAAERAYHRTKLLGRLRAAFKYCELTANRKMPDFIGDYAIDAHVRRMKLFVRGIPVKKFEDQKDGLEAHLNISIVRIYEEPNDKSRINIIYAMADLPRLAHLATPDSYADGEIPIGMSHEGPVSVKLKDVGNILVAGHIGGGKSNFLKTATSTLTLNNPEAEVYFFDFKGGMELADLLNNLGQSQKNFSWKEGTVACAEELAKIGARLDTRFAAIAGAGVASYDEYLKKQISTKNADNEVVKPERMKKMYIIIDEIAQLYSRSPGVSKEKVLEAREAVNRIARQGRAAAVHLIVATQKPDSTSFDQTVKSNLPAVLCFPMSTQASSVTALGTKRAYELDPGVKGRAIWKYGPRMSEVQTYLFE
jgi:energy-coupling factor transporter ATP-binding protein EcfA2